jgi:hypothetical protein
MTRTVKSDRCSRSIRIEKLEDRCLLTANLFLDFGDSFPTGGFTLTADQLRDTFASNGIQGPDLVGLGDPANRITAATQLRFNGLQDVVTDLQAGGGFDYNGDGTDDAADYTDLRAAVVSLAQRYYAPFDINVQIAPALNNTSSNTYRAAIITTLQQGANVDGERDAWMFVTGVVRTDTGDAVGDDAGLFGIAAGADIPGNNDDVRANARDDSAVAFADTILAGLAGLGVLEADTRLAYTATHEAGHTLGLWHTWNGVTERIRNVTVGAAGAGSIAVNGDIRSDLVVGDTFDVRDNNFNVIGTFTIAAGSTFNAGTGNTTINVVEAVPNNIATNGISIRLNYVTDQLRLVRTDIIPGSTGEVNRVNFDFFTRFSLLGDYPVDLNPGGAIDVAYMPYNILARNANLGLATNAPSYITGTGAFDQITITRVNGTTANVSVQAHRDSSFANQIGATLNYQVDYTRGLLVEGGFSDDQIIVDANLGVTITVRGMEGDDQLIVMGNSAPSGTYTPGTNTANGLDDHPDLRGSVVIGGTTINFEEFDATSTVSVQDVGRFTMRTPLGNDSLSISSPVAGHNQITGTSGGVNVVTLEFFNVTDFILDAATNDNGGRNDVIDLNDAITATGLQNFTVNTGSGADTDRLDINTNDISLPVAGGAFAFNGGTGGLDSLVFTTASPTAVTYTPDGFNDPSRGTLTFGGASMLFTGLEFVEPVTPVIDAISTSSSSINEGDTITLTGNFIDPGSLSTHTVNIQWDDGASTSVYPPTGSRSFSTTYTYQDDHPESGTLWDEFDIVVRVTDNDSLTDDAMEQITVKNVEPTLAGVDVSASSIIESESVTVSGTFTDPALGVASETFTATALWSDGVTTSVTVDSTAGTFTTTRDFPDDHPQTGTPSDDFTVAITITDDDTGASDPVTSPKVTVNNVDPVITSLGSDATFDEKAEEGDTVSISAAFTDIGVLDTHRATINWGEPGGVDEPATIIQGSGSGTVIADHVYNAGGVYTLTLTLRDDDTGTDVSTTLAVVVGAGVNDGVLQVVGSDDSNNVTVNKQGKGLYKVHADFFAERNHRTFDAATIDYIQIWLCDGDDHVNIAGNVLVPASVYGGGGNDHLSGGGGRAILIGGLGSDRLVGGPEDDIMIGGTTDYDFKDAALLALLDEWNSGRSYSDRVDNIRTGSGPILGGTGYMLAKGVTVFDDGESDKLTGSSGMDWFFFDPDEDDATDRKGAEEAN